MATQRFCAWIDLDEYHAVDKTNPVRLAASFVPAWQTIFVWDPYAKIPQESYELQVTTLSIPWAFRGRR